MKNAKTFTKDDKKYVLRIGDVAIRIEAWVDVVSEDGGEPTHIYITDFDQQDFRDGKVFDPFLEANPHLETVLTDILKRATEKL